MWLAIVCTISVLLNIGLGYVLRRYLKRLFEYDDLYQVMIDDVETNLSQFERMRKSSILTDDDEVRSAHKNMMVMASRLDEFANQMEEVAGRKLRKVSKPMQPVNVTKEAEKLG